MKKLLWKNKMQYWKRAWRYLSFCQTVLYLTCGVWNTFKRQYNIWYLSLSSGCFRKWKRVKKDHSETSGRLWKTAVSFGRDQPFSTACLSHYKVTDFGNYDWWSTHLCSHKVNTVSPSLVFVLQGKVRKNEEWFDGTRRREDNDIRKRKRQRKTDF